MIRPFGVRPCVIVYPKASGYVRSQWLSNKSKLLIVVVVVVVKSRHVTSDNKGAKVHNAIKNLYTDNTPRMRLFLVTRTCAARRLDI